MKPVRYSIAGGWKEANSWQVMPRFDCMSYRLLHIERGADNFGGTRFRIFPASCAPTLPKAPAEPALETDARLRAAGEPAGPCYT